ncbi:MAG: extracellular solute-binding protein [Myxococcota bacterium]|nr:extracellular solute-binding protein [Myxococcota bacterium]
MRRRPLLSLCLSPRALIFAYVRQCSLALFTLSLVAFFPPFWVNANASETQELRSPLVLWHGYRGDERRWLDGALERWQRAGGAPVRALPLPHDALSNKLRAAIPRGNGPDLFIAAHDRAGSWAEAGLLETIGAWVTEEELADLFPAAIRALTVRGNLFALPLAAKTLVLYYYPALTGEPPEKLSTLVEQAQRFKAGGPRRWGIGQGDSDSLYFHAPWLHGFGARVFLRDGSLGLCGPKAEASLALVHRFEKTLLSPPGLDGALAANYFREQRIAFVINGPWFRGDLDGREGWSIAPLPTIDETGQKAAPYLGVEGIFLSAARRSERGRRLVALDLARYLSGPAEAARRLDEGALPARRSVYRRPAQNEMQRIWRSTFRRQFEESEPLSNDPRMGGVWTPMARALSLARRGVNSPREALKEACSRIEEGWR